MTHQQADFTSRTLLRTVKVLIFASAMIAIGPQTSMANSPPVAELQKAIAALEARVAALEEQLQHSKAVTQQAEASAPPFLLASLTETTSAPAPMALGGSGHRLQEEPDNFVWSGLYWGTAFGYGAAFSNSRYRNVGRDEFTSSSSSTSVSGTGDQITLSTDTDTSVFEDEFVTSGQSNGKNRSEGALADLYLGVSTHVTPRLLAGVQVEGTLAAMPFRSRIKTENVVSSSTNSFSFSSISSNGNTNQFTDSPQSVSTGTRSGGESDLQLDWMVSVIGRAGWLATPSTLLYGLAGWSYAHFEVDRVPFGFGSIDDFESDGPTIGGGIEQRLSPKWSLRAEYRYTDFGKESFRSVRTGSSSGSGQNASASAFEDPFFSSSTSGTGSSSLTSTSNATSTGSIENDMHVGRIGVTRYFTMRD
ncbi:MAG: outer membrane beta-barrel protein [Methyloceanibacter sp.]